MSVTDTISDAYETHIKAAWSPVWTKWRGHAHTSFLDSFHGGNALCS
jgi:hypothetical protein